VVSLKKHTKSNIRNLINTTTAPEIQKSIHRLRKRISYLESKSKQLTTKPKEGSRQVKYLCYHLRKLSAIV